MHWHSHMPINRPPELDPVAIVARLKEGGQLRRGELEGVKRRIADASPRDEDVYYLARVLGLGAEPSKENVKLLEALFSLSTDEWGLHGVVNALCSDWGLSRNYIGKLIEMSGPSVWESHQSATIAALSSLGTYLQCEDDRCAVAALLEYIDAASQTPTVRESASLREYRNAVWHALDQWMRGREAQVDPTRFDPGSQIFRDAKERFSALRS
jgi:hypothetical protein